MLGLIIAFLYALYQYLINHAQMLTIWVNSTSFLYHWYIVTAIIASVVMVILAIIALLGGTALGAGSGGILGGVLGFLGGGALSVFAIAVFAIVRGLGIVGVFLLKSALICQAPTGAIEWDTTKLIFGGLALVISLIMGGLSSSSSSSSKK